MEFGRFKPSQQLIFDLESGGDFSPDTARAILANADQSDVKAVRTFMEKYDLPINELNSLASYELGSKEYVVFDAQTIKY